MSAIYRGATPAFIAVACALGALPATAQTVAPGSEPNATALEEVLVTARRREERLENTPVAVTVFSANDLRERSIETITGVAQFTPNLAVAPAPGTKNAAILTIRGQVQADSLLTLDPAVGVYLDDVYLARGYAVFGDFLDIRSVEVLKGPQGTLYGRNTTGGAIKLISAPPSLSEALGSIRLTAGNYQRFEGEVALSAPLLTDVLAVRYAGAYRVHDGYTRSILVSQPALTPLKTIRTDDKHTESHRLSVLWRPNDDLNVALTGDYFLAKDNAGLTAGAKGDIFAAAGYRLSPQRAGDFDTALTNIDPFARAENFGVALNVDYRLTDALFAKLITSWRGAEQDTSANTDGVVDGGGAAVTFESALFQRQRQVSIEGQIGGEAWGRLSWLAGVYGFREYGSDITSSFVRTSPQAVGGNIVNKSLSAYVHAEYAWTDRLSTSAGYRYTEDTKRLLGRSVVNGICVYSPGPGIINDGARCESLRETKFDYPAWSASIDYQWRTNVLVYGRVDRSSRSGGHQLRGINDPSLVPFEPEVATNYEFGVKTQLLDRRLRVNFATFHTDISELQQKVTQIFPVGAAQVIVNFGTAKANGFELDGAFRITDNLSVQGALGYTDINFATQQFRQIYAPKWVGSAAVVYRRPVAFGELMLRADYSWRSAFFITPNTASIVSDPVGAIIGSNKLLDARAALELPNGLAVAVFGKNLTDENYYLQGSYSGPISGRTVGPPRTWGVELSYAF